MSKSLPMIKPYDPHASCPVPTDVMQAQLEQSIEAGPSMVLWDLLGACNLRCPSCPTGVHPKLNPRGMVDDEAFYATLDKLREEFGPRQQLSFYNWSEAFLHPKIVEYSAAAAEREFHLHLSTNGQILRDPEGVAQAGAKTIRFSISGVTQEIYEVGHRGGRIDRVIDNMRRLADALRSTGSRTRVHIYFLKYRHNLHEEAPARALAESLGFGFQTNWAYLMPIDHIIDYVEGQLDETTRDFTDRYIVPTTDRAVAATQPLRHRPCTLIDQLTLDFRSEILLCCGTYETATSSIGSYFDLDWPEIQRRRYGHRLCRKCMHYGVHVLGPYFDDPELRSEIDAIARASLADSPAARVLNHAGVSLPVLSTPGPAG